MEKINVGLDLDGVVYKYHEAAYDYFVGIGMYDKGFVSFWTEFIPSLSDEEQDYIISIPFLYESYAINSEALEYLNKLSEIADLYYITARHNELRRVTERWLRKNKIPQDYNLVMTKDKASYIKLLKISYFVDDFISQVENVGNFCNSMLFAQPWNREKQNILPTVRSIKEFYEIIKEKQNGN